MSNVDFAGSVLADQSDPLSSFDRKIERPIDDLFAIALRHVPQLQDLTPAGRGQGKFEPHAFGVALPLDQFDLLQLLDAGLNLAGFVGLVTEAVDKFLDSRDLFRLAVGGGFHLRVTSGAQLLKLRVIAAEFLNRPVANLPDMGGDPIEKTQCRG